MSDQTFSAASGENAAQVTGRLDSLEEAKAVRVRVHEQVALADDDVEILTLPAYDAATA